MTRTKIAIMAGAMALLAAPKAQAQAATECTTQPCTSLGQYIKVTASATVNDAISFTVDKTAIDLGTPGAANFDGTAANAKPSADADVVTVTSNRPWKVSLKSTGDFGYTAPTGSGLTRSSAKSASDVLWGTSSAAAAATAMSTTDADVFAASNAPTASATKTVYYKTKWNYATDIPGSYSLTLNYTLSAP